MARPARVSSPGSAHEPPPWSKPSIASGGSPRLIIGLRTPLAAPRLLRRAWLRPLTALLLGIAATATVAVLPVAPAAAHTSLTSSYPEANSTGPDPDAVRLTFTEEIQQGPGSAVSIGGPDGPIAAAAPSFDGREVAVRPDRGLPPARYSVAYRVIARDGHPITGRYAFTVGDPGPVSSAASSGGPVEAAPLPAPAASETSDSSGTPTALYVVLGLLALVAVAGFAQLIRQTRTSSR